MIEKVKKKKKYKLPKNKLNFKGRSRLTKFTICCSISSDGRMWQHGRVVMSRMLVAGKAWSEQSCPMSVCEEWLSKLRSAPECWRRRLIPQEVCSCRDRAVDGPGRGEVGGLRWCLRHNGRRLLLTWRLCVGRSLWWHYGVVVDHRRCLKEKHG